MNYNVARLLSPFNDMNHWQAGVYSGISLFMAGKCNIINPLASGNLFNREFILHQFLFENRAKSHGKG